MIVRRDPVLLWRSDVDHFVMPMIRNISEKLADKFIQRYGEVETRPQDRMAEKETAINIRNGFRGWEQRFLNEIEEIVEALHAHMHEDALPEAITKVRIQVEVLRDQYVDLLPYAARELARSTTPGQVTLVLDTVFMGSMESDGQRGIRNIVESLEEIKKKIITGDVLR